MTVWVSMLRGVNVGGHSRIKMKPLQELYEFLGLQNVRTMLQSGNVLFTSGLKDRDRLARRIEQEIERRFELKVTVLLRTLGDLKMLVERGPTLAENADPRKLLVMFLDGVADARTQKALLTAHKGPEMIEIRGPEIYLYYPDGVGRSKLSNAFIEARLNLAGTSRNWNTLKKLIEAGNAIEAGSPRAA